MNLKERIGIDRTTLYDFVVESIDFDKVNEANRAAVIAHQKRPVKLRLVEGSSLESPIVLNDGSRVLELVVTHKFFGQLSVKYSTSNFDGTMYVETSLQLMVAAGGNNLQNLTAEQYKLRVKEVFCFLHDCFGIKINSDKIKIKKMEINTTFVLEDEFKEYANSVLLMAKNLPPKRYGDSEGNIKVAAWHEANVKLLENSFETALVKNGSRELKFYDKGKQLYDLGIVPECNHGIMRVEYTIKDRRLIESAFGDNLVESLSDEKIIAWFKKNFNRDVAVRYYSWRTENSEQLKKLVQKHRDQQQQWTNTFFRECRQFEAVHSFPLLFDLDDLRKVIRELEPAGSRNAGKKYKRLIKVAKFERDLIGHNKRSLEIINKIMNM